MFYNGITEKVMDFTQWRVRVDLGDLSTTFFWYDHDPSEAEVIASTEAYIIQANTPAPSSKTQKLMEAEDRYVLFCRSIGLPDKASSDDIQVLYLSIKESGQPMQALEMAVQALAMINDVTQNGGKWADIEYHGIITA